MATIRWTDSIWAPNTWVCDDCGAGGSGAHNASQRAAAEHVCPVDPITFADTCCGKCLFGTCYVDQMTGA